MYFAVWCTAQVIIKIIITIIVTKYTLVTKSRISDNSKEGIEERKYGRAKKKTLNRTVSTLTLSRT